MTAALAGVALVLIVGARPSSAGAGHAQAFAAGATRLTIPYLANATKPADLDFTAAECDIATSGEEMICRFRQLFLTASPIDAAACVITTNGYERTFHRNTPSRWSSAGAPVGPCQVVETTTLEDGGSTRWTMSVQTAATLRADTPECRAALRAPEVYDWRSVKRPLPCTSIQPGAIER